MSTPRFLVNGTALLEPNVILMGAELRHLRARRVSIGGEVILSDGSGHIRQGVVTELSRHRAVIRLLSDAVAQPASPLRLVLAQALLKSSKTDLVIEKATELGVSELVVLTSGRSVVRATSEHQARWQRIAASATKQSQRSSVPRITGPTAFEGFLSAAAADVQLLFWENCRAGELAHVKVEQPRSNSVLAVVGPEGGFSTSEAEAAQRAGFRLISLGTRILRADTAALVAVTLCQYLWGDLGPSRT